MKKNILITSALVTLLSISIYGQINTWDVSTPGVTVITNPTSIIQIVGIPNDALNDTIFIGDEHILALSDTNLLLQPYIDDPNQALKMHYRNEGDTSSCEIENPLALDLIIGSDPPHIFYDAIALVNADPTTVDLIFAKHGIADPAANNFLKDLSRSSDPAGPSVVTPAEMQSFLRSASSALGGLDVTRYADGLARFLVTRTKQELSIAFFERLQKKILSNQDINDLFPQTATILGRIGTDIYQYQKYIQNLRQAFDLDVKQLHTRFDQIIQNHCTFFDANPGLENLISICTDIWDGVVNEAHPGQILANVEIRPSLHQLGNFGGGLQFAQLVSKSLESKEDDSFWVLQKELTDALSTDHFFKYFLGLFIESAKKLDIKLLDGELSTDLFDVINDHAAEILKKEESFAAVLQGVSQLSAALRPLLDRQQAGEDLNAEDLVQYVQVLANLLNKGQEMVHVLAENNWISISENRLKSLENYVDATQSAAYFLGDLSAKRYSAATFHILNLYEAVFTKPAKDAIEATGAPTLSILQKEVLFLAQMADAETSAEVEQIIAHFALPAQSYRHKRATPFNISLNAYLGLAYFAGDGDSTGFGSVTAPVGLGVNFGMGSKKVISSLSIYGNFIDIGAIAAFRFGSDDSQVAKIFLREIFSPGIHMSLGIGNTPLALNVGYQSLPLLQNVGSDENAVRIKRTGRFAVSLAVDIPIFNIYK